MPLLRRKSLFAAKVEGTPGSAETLANGDAAFNAYNFDVQPNITVEEREGQAGFNRLAGVPGGFSGTATVTTDLGWDGTATLPTWATVLFPALGFVNTTGTFNPTTEAPGSNVKTLTIAKYLDGVRKQIHGAMGNASIILPTGRMCRLEANFTGAWTAVSDTALLTPTYPTANALRFASGTITFNSVNIKVEQVTIDFGNTVILREDASTATGFSTALITDRNPRITINPEATTVATLNTYGLFTAGTQAAFSVTLDGPNSSTLVISATNCQVMNSQEGDRNGMAIDDIELACQKGSATDRELTFEFNETT